jgi:tRNA pseudouridine55 synthase
MNTKQTSQQFIPTVAVFGAFDILHPGHISLISQAKKIGKPVVIIGRDSTIKRIKGTQPFYNEQTRKKNLEQTNLAAEVKLGNEDSPYKIIETLKPNIILLGPDQKAFTQNLATELKRLKLDTKIIRAQNFHPEFFKSSKIRPALENHNAGFLPIYKPAGISSHDVVNQIRKIANTKKVGHAGTLDPLAEGLLIIGIHEAVKLLSWWHYFPKTYEVELELDKTSNTYDREGTITNLPATNTTLSDIKKIIPNFLGQQLQIPPQFSAKKVNGKKAYQLARQGIAINLKKQNIQIFRLELLNYNYPYLSLSVICSSGTYIRSLTHDIGKKLNTDAIMTKLIRTKIGGFKPAHPPKTKEILWPQQIISPAELIEKINELFIESFKTNEIGPSHHNNS